jgi:hypothetical protein
MVLSPAQRALDEVVGLPIAGHPVRTWLKRQLTKIGRQIDQFLPPKGRLVAGGLFGGIAGWLNAFLADGFAVQIHYPIAIAMVGITVANLLSRRLDRSLFKFLAETVATWGLYAVLWAATYGHVTENLVLWVGLWTAAAAITGWMLMRDASTDDHGSGLPAEVPPQIVPDGSSMEGNTDLLRRVMWPAIATGFDECRRAT